ncbi:MAG: GAF domain-containing sensor histidine kinase [Deltaproteobacteria bacterium]|nr:GAF domain-containing sensor histidine kinase [Deltaproteobacteria bacterium]
MDTPEKNESAGGHCKIEALRDSLEQQEKQIQQMTQITEQLNLGYYLDEALERLYTTFKDLLDFQRIDLALLEDKETVILRWGKSDLDDKRLFEGHTSKLTDSGLLNAETPNKPLIISDLKFYCEKHPESEIYKFLSDEGVLSVLSCPLVCAESILGFLFFSSIHAQAFHEPHTRQFGHIARELTNVVEKTHMAELGERRHQQLNTVINDFKNPLAIIKGYTDMMVQGASGELSDQQISMLITVQKNCNRMQKIINDLSNVSMGESGRVDMLRRETNIINFLQNCHQTNFFQAREKSIILNLIIKEVLPTCTIDAARMSQVMDALVSNAIKYSRSNTTVEIIAELLFNKLMIFVKDQGVGIPDTEIPFVFDRSSRLKGDQNAAKDKALRLCDVRQIVEAHKGSIGIESEYGKGTTVSITIPMTKKAGL